MAGEHYDDITADRYEYFIVDTGTFENRCPDPILESDHFPGKWRMVLACSGSSTADLEKTRRTGSAALLSIAIGFLITNVLLKNMVARPRPFDAYTEIIPLITRPTDFSFPSGHTCASFACALVFFRMLPKKYGVPAVILAGMVAFSRLYLGVHYPGDVLGGFLVAVFTSTLAYHLVQAYCKKAKEQSEGLSHKWKRK